MEMEGFVGGSQIVLDLKSPRQSTTRKAPNNANTLPFPFSSQGCLSLFLFDNISLVEVCVFLFHGVPIKANGLPTLV